MTFLITLGFTIAAAFGTAVYLNIPRAKALVVAGVAAGTATVAHFIASGLVALLWPLILLAVVAFGVWYWLLRERYPLPQSAEQLRANISQTARRAERLFRTMRSRERV